MGSFTSTTTQLGHFTFKSLIMKSFIFLTLIGLAFGSDLFVGSWKEDQDQRQGRSDYLYYRGLNWFKRVYVTNANFELTMNVAKEGSTYTISGKKGPKYEDYQFQLVPDNITRTHADLGALGGPRMATAELWTTAW